jgi:hypothetical protein
MLCWCFFLVLNGDIIMVAVVMLSDGCHCASAITLCGIMQNVSKLSCVILMNF